MILRCCFAGRAAVIITVALICSATVSAADPDSGILWEIRQQDERIGYLFGTIHSDRRDVLDLPAPVQRAFDQSRRFAFELDLETLDPARINRLMRGTGGETLTETLPSGLWRRARAAARDRGLGADAAATLEPWALSIMLALPPTDPRRILDHALQRDARRAGHPITGLESPAEQLSIFDRLPVDRQIEMLRQTVELVETGENMRLYENVVDAWLNADLARLVELAARYPALPEGRANDDLMDRLLRRRNERMVERMQPVLADGQAFIAVGALHLAGEDGVVRLLRRRGYVLRPIY